MKQGADRNQSSLTVVSVWPIRMEARINARSSAPRAHSTCQWRLSNGLCSFNQYGFSSFLHLVIIHHQSMTSYRMKMGSMTPPNSRKAKATNTTPYRVQLDGTDKLRCHVCQNQIKRSVTSCTELRIFNLRGGSAVRGNLRIQLERAC